MESGGTRSRLPTHHGRAAPYRATELAPERGRSATSDDAAVESKTKSGEPGLALMPLRLERSNDIGVAQREGDVVPTIQQALTT